MELTDNQINKANVLIQKYGFCTLETQEKLYNAGFFDTVKPAFAIRIVKSTYTQVELCLYETGDLLGISHILPMPQLHEIWAAIPETVRLNDYWCHKQIKRNDTVIVNSSDFQDNEYLFFNSNLCEAACLLYLKLHENKLL